ncbi:MAG: hypothetical protein JWO31_242 [Phycisphaerales bacterium]|nr:hypothetical protein [Phycisphaerales bacterium]
MTSRQRFLEHYGPALRWLPTEDAAAAYRDASRYDRRDRYGLSPEAVTDILRDQVRDNDFEALRTWMADATGGVGDVLIVFGAEDICRTTAAFLVAEWENLLSRNDAIVLSVDSDWVMFCSHKDEFEVGRRVPARAG